MTNARLQATGECVDARGLTEAQLYRCLDSANQGWNVNATAGSGTGTVAGSMAGSIRETFDRRGSMLGTRTSTSFCTVSHRGFLPCTPPHAPCGVLYLAAMRGEG